MKRKTGFIALVLSAAIIFSGLPPFLKTEVRAAETDDKFETTYSKKLYSNLENKGNYTRPSASKILSDYKAGVHPRIMLTSDKVSQLKSEIKSSPKASLYNTIKSKADALVNGLKDNEENYLFNWSDLVYKGRMPGSKAVGGNGADEFREDMMVLGMMYQLTGSTDYSNAAWKILNRVTSYDEINWSHDLDFGIICQGYAIGYDWMYSAWANDSSKLDRLNTKIKSQCLEYANHSYTDNNTSKDNHVVMGTFLDHNHNAFVNSGVAMVSLALMDKYPNVTSSLVYDSFRCLERNLNRYAPDGVTSEGPEYQIHTIDNLAYLFSSLETAMKPSAIKNSLYGLDTCPGFKDGKALLAVYAETSDVGQFSFSDTLDGLISCGGMIYFEQHYGINGFREQTYNRVIKKDSASRVEALCWFEKDNGKSDVSRDFVANGNGKNDGDISLATFRNNFESGQSYVGIKAGKTKKECFIHMDEGSFIFSANGVKWAVDMGKDNYSIDGYTAPTKNDKRWNIFRIRPDGHNVLLVGPTPTGTGYELGKTATLTAATSDKEAKAVVDLSDLVSKASSDRRGFLLTDDRRSLVVRDEVTLTGTSDLYWVMYTAQDVKVDSDNKVTLTQQNGSKKLSITFASSVKGKASVEKAAPWSLAPTVSGSVKQNTNDSYKRIVYKISGASGSVSITAKLTPSNVTSSPDVSTYGKIDSWKLSSGVTPTVTTAPSATADPNPTLTNAPDFVQDTDPTAVPTSVPTDPTLTPTTVSTAVSTTVPTTAPTNTEAKPSVTTAGSNLTPSVSPSATATAGAENTSSDSPTSVPGLTHTIGETIYRNGVSYEIGGTSSVSIASFAGSESDVVIPDSVSVDGVSYKVTEIKDKAFMNNKKIKSLVIGSDVIRIGNKAFYGCKNLKKVTGGPKLESIGSKAFGKCSKLSVFKISSPVLKKIGASCFYKDKKLKTLDIRKTVSLTKKGVRSSLKKSSVKKVLIKKSKAKTYKKIFTKKVVGRKVSLKKLR